MRFIGNIEKDAQIRAVASGALPSGDAVVVNSDGTVSVVAGQDQDVGTTVTFNAGITDEPVSVFDANTNKVVVAYRDESNSDYLTAIVGTVSGTSISFGSEVVAVSSAVSFLSIAYDSAAQNVVIAFKNQGSLNYGTAVVGSVSGTSISFGASAVFNTAGTEYTGAAFDSSNNKVVISYFDQGNSNYGTAIVGTVSGTTISFGTPVVFESSDSAYQSCLFDSTTNKVVVVYRDQGNSFRSTAIVGTVSGTSISFGTASAFSSSTSSFTAANVGSGKIVAVYQDIANSNYGTAAVGTVSGTSISFGTPVVFEAASSQNFSVGYDSAADVWAVAYRDNGNNQFGTLVIGSVSGTSISFGTPFVFEESSTQLWPASFSYDSSNQKLVLPFRGSSNHGRALVLQPASTNLTAENFIGFAAHTYADTQSALINSTCTVDRNQSGLTAGQTYYVQTDGTLSTTPGDPSVEAGTAISSTEIIVKG